MPDPTEQVDREYRVVIVRHGRRGQRWRWALETSYYGRNWSLTKTGYAWSLSGAITKANQAAYFPDGLTRVEWLMTTVSPKKEPVPRPSTPLPPRFVATASETFRSRPESK